MILIAVIALDGVIPFDLSTPCEVFGRVSVSGTPEPYRVMVCGEKKIVKAEPFAGALGFKPPGSSAHHHRSRH
jgi:hypothetical protein